MLQFSFKKSSLPMTMRWAGALVVVQAAVIFVAGVFVGLAGTVLGSGSSVAFAGTTLSGVVAASLGVVFLALAGLALYLSTALARLVPWSRTALICFEALLIVLFLARGELSINLAVNVLLCVVVGVLLVTPSASIALAAPRDAAHPTDTPATSPLRSP